MWSVCISFSRKDSGLGIYHLFVWSNINFLHNSQWTIFPIQSSLVLIFSYANLLHSLMWLIISSLSPDNLHLLICCMAFLIALFCNAIRRDSLYHLRFFFLNYVQVFSYKIRLVCLLKNPTSCFSSQFCFLVIFAMLIFALSVLFFVFFLVAVISFHPCFFM